MIDKNERPKSINNKNYSSSYILSRKVRIWRALAYLHLLLAGEKKRLGLHQKKAKDVTKILDTNRGMILKGRERSPTTLT
jgi:hypothetical protein